MFSRFFAIYFLVLISRITAAGQDVKVHGRFYADSIKIGEAIPWSLTARYPSSLNVVFPDSTFSYAPFEFQRKKYFQTISRNNISYDSAVYYLTTYEIDKVQALRLPAFVIHSGDCTAVYSNTDTVILKQLVRLKLDSLSIEKLPLKTNTDYFAVSWLLNYPLLLIVGAGLLTVLLVFWIIFGKRIRRYYELKRMTRRHSEFLRKFSSSVHALQQNFSTSQAESIFVLWKKYMETLAARPYTRYTAREIMRMEKNELLAQALTSLNMIIYAGINPQTAEPFDQLGRYTETLFARKTEELKHG